MTETLKALIFDAATGEAIERELNEDELAQREIDLVDLQDQQAQADARASARQSALAKLKKLGLTAAEIEAL